MGSLIGILVLFAMAAALVYLWGTAAASRALATRERDELEGLRALVDDLKETAWEHRELDSALSVIVLDKIRTYERRESSAPPDPRPSTLAGWWSPSTASGCAALARRRSS